ELAREDLEVLVADARSDRDLDLHRLLLDPIDREAIAAQPGLDLLRGLGLHDAALLLAAARRGFPLELGHLGLLGLLERYRRAVAGGALLPSEPPAFRIIVLSSSTSLECPRQSSSEICFLIYRSISDWFIVCMPNFDCPICICE